MPVAPVPARMPTVVVRLPRSLREHWGGAESMRVEAANVRDAVRALGDAHPGLASRVLDEHGRPREFVHLFLNERAVHAADIGEVRVAEGDTLHILASVAGGATGAGVKKGETVLALGTKKGLFLAHSRDRKRWRVRGPWFEGTSVHHAALDPRDGRTVWAGVTSDHWGPSVQRTRTWGSRWLRAKAEPAFPEGSDLAVKRVWHVAPGIDGDVYAGVEPAGLFRSRDGGRTWEGVEGFNSFPGRAEWFPGGGGLCLHTILPHPTDARRMTVAASAVGIFETRDEGVTWHLRNGGIRADHLPEKATAEAMPGTCPHKLVRDPRTPGTLLMQNHWGVYRRKEADDKWTDIGRGLPSRFGFPMAALPDGSGFFTIPLAGDFNRVTPEGAMAVWRLDAGARSWKPQRKGLPQAAAFATVLREGLATDGRDPGGVYFGTTGGEVWASRDEGRSWASIAARLPPVLSVDAGEAG